jgi:hypothetical protein
MLDALESVQQRGLAGTKKARQHRYATLFGMKSNVHRAPPG